VDTPAVYEFSVKFFTNYLGITGETGLKYLRLEVITPDAVISSDKRPLFRTDPQSVERHLANIQAYRARQRAVRNNALSYA
jgi:hypothetical protein